MRIAALVKQIPAFEELQLGADGRLERAGLELEMNPYCRRAVSQAVELAAAVGDGTVTVFTLGPPSAADVLREAIAWGTSSNVHTEGILLTDPEFAGSDTLATARALAAAIEAEGPFDLVIAGRNSVDAETGQVGPELAELLDLPFATGVRYLSVQGQRLHLRCEHDDGWVQLEIAMPVLISVAERLIDPCKVAPDQRAVVPPDRIRTVRAANLGPGPWGAPGSPTRVGAVQVHTVRRDRKLLTGPITEQVREAVELLQHRRALTPSGGEDATEAVPPPAALAGASIGVVVEHDRPHLTRELLGAAANAAAAIGGHVVAITEDPDTDCLGPWGADDVVLLEGRWVEEDVAAAVAGWARTAEPWAVLAPSTAWGREVAGRVAAQLGAGLTGDAIGFELDGDRLVAWKPAFGGQMVAAITSSSPVQMATVRVGALPRLEPRDSAAPVRSLRVRPRGRVRVAARTRNDDLDALADAAFVVGVGRSVPPGEYPAIQPLLEVLGAELAATRKVTDRGWLPRSRQVGITGRTIAPRLYVAVGVGGKFNHMVGVRGAGTILAVDSDPGALVFEQSDIGIVGDWREVVPALVDALARAHVAA
jgi:electron transfer flavoprotein alpha subunit